MATKHQPRKTKETWRRIVEDQRSSGLTIKEYCSTNQITTSNFYLWRRKLTNAPEAQSKIQPQDQDWLPIAIPSAAGNTSARWDIELALPGGAVLKLKSA